MFKSTEFTFLWTQSLQWEFFE